MTVSPFHGSPATYKLCSDRTSETTEQTAIEELVNDCSFDAESFTEAFVFDPNNYANAEISHEGIVEKMTAVCIVYENADHAKATEILDTVIDLTGVDVYSRKLADRILETINALDSGSHGIESYGTPYSLINTGDSYSASMGIVDGTIIHCCQADLIEAYEKDQAAEQSEEDTEEE